MKIGIVTVLFKSDPVIAGFIASMNAQRFTDFHVLCIENDVENQASEAAIRADLKVPFSFIRNKSNVGVATANNQGLDFFLPDESFTHVLFLNNDIEVNADFLQQQVDILIANPHVDALAPKSFYYDTPGKPWYAGGKLSYLKGGCRHFGHNKPDRLTRNLLYPVDYAPTCSLIVKSRPLKDSGIRMWEELFVYYDDTIFCLELKRAGIKMYYTPTIHLQHKISSSTGGSRSDFSRYYLTRNWLYCGLKTRNLAVAASAIVLTVFHAVARHKIELRALRDAFLMKRTVA
ncbi:glycosyltransferase family 2 protein [Paraburkholderia aromaticivorans]|uniref:glycosyltransferase family 2 protein n=1 Tax=Paraburkholderia aromaticivorans TaxID=2026199 RepID=UPI0014561E89|nr:glycosyltransferase family 2 protein [Paraburkholderia aromaticivorans]